MSVIQSQTREGSKHKWDDLRQVEGLKGTVLAGKRDEYCAFDSPISYTGRNVKLIYVVFVATGANELQMDEIELSTPRTSLMRLHSAASDEDALGTNLPQWKNNWRPQDTTPGRGLAPSPQIHTEYAIRQLPTHPAS